MSPINTKSKSLGAKMKWPENKPRKAGVSDGMYLFPGFSLFYAVTVSDQVTSKGRPDHIPDHY